ncbi:hypothetical protein SAMN05880590_11311 [Rhizobium sp. RU35A]|nr:hypothetical protein SAMN05880590_11311 [Rhizobium sp. RU35A]
MTDYLRDVAAFASMMTFLVCVCVYLMAMGPGGVPTF